MTYEEYIQSIIDTRGQWNIPDGEYFEMHHILPKCIGGKSDYKNGTFRRHSHNLNCIWLYPREHFIAHKLLAEQYSNCAAICRAYWNMCSLNKNKIILTAEEYEQARCFVHNNIHGPWKGCKPQDHPMYGRDRSGKNNPFYGKTFSDETKKRIYAGIRKWQLENPEAFSKIQSRPGGKNGKAKRVYCIETDTEFECIKYAIAWLKENNKSGFSTLTIENILSNKEICGYHWKILPKDKKD